MSNSKREDVFSRVRHEVGNTPIVRLELPNGCFAYCKEEWRNPSGSHYDRVYADLLEGLEGAGTIVPGETELVDATTGNSGAALARAAQILGYRCTIAAPADLPGARIKQIERYGARVILSAKGQYVGGAVRKMREHLIDQRRSGEPTICVDHSRREASARALSSIGREVCCDLDGVRIDYFVGAIGNGLSIAGVTNELTKHSPNMQLVGVEPVEAPSWFVKKYPGRFEQLFGHEPRFKTHGLLGAGGWGVHFPAIALKSFDRIELVSKEQWAGGCASLEQNHNIHVGHTSGGCFVAAKRMADEARASSFLLLFYDPAWKYEAELPESVASP